jgi:hypothetical protein
MAPVCSGACLFYNGCSARDSLCRRTFPMLNRMAILRTVSVSVLLFLIAALPGVAAVAKPFQTGKILVVEQKMHSRVLYYLVNTPIIQDDPYYEIKLQVKDMVFTTEYTPRHSADSLPLEWVAEAPVEARVAKHYIFLKQPGGDELQLVIIKRKTAASALKEADLPSQP